MYLNNGIKNFSKVLSGLTVTLDVFKLKKHLLKKILY